MTTLLRPVPLLLRSVCATALLGACSLYTSYALANNAEISDLLKANQPTQALALIDKQLAQSPKDAQLRFLQGVAQAMANKPKEAIDTFTALTKDYPELPEPYNNLAVLYANQNQLDKSREALERAIRTNPSYSTAHENLGDIYAKLAGQAYSKALQLNANQTDSVQPKLELIHELFTTSQNTALAQAALNKPLSTQVAAAQPQTATTPTAATQAKVEAQASSATTNPTPVGSTSAPAPLPTPASTAATTPASANAAADSAPSAPASNAAAPAATPAPAATANATAAKDSAAGAPAPATSDASASAAEQAVQAAVQKWAKAWAAQDMASYLGAYSPNFQTPGKQSRSAWERERRSRIVGKKHISVQLSDLQVQLDAPNRATVQFRQAYKANNFQANSHKTLVLEQRQGKWLIVRESVGS